MANNDPTQPANWPEDLEEPTAPTMPIVIEKQVAVPPPGADDPGLPADEVVVKQAGVSIPDRPTEKQASLPRSPLGKTQLVRVGREASETATSPMTPLPANAGHEESERAQSPITPLPLDADSEENESTQSPMTPLPTNTGSEENESTKSLMAPLPMDVGYGENEQRISPRRSSPVIVVRNLTKTYLLGKRTRVQALRGVSLDVYPGEFVTIMGPSGSGKSTFMNLLGCLDSPSSGEYWLAGQLVSRLSNDQLASMRNQLLGFVFQGFNLLGRATAVRNVALPMVYAGLSRREREKRARKVLNLVGLGGRLDHKPSELSGGQQQRVAIARALVNGPSLLLADEPTGNLDSRTSIEIMGVLQALNEQGLTIVLVTHDSKVAAYAKRQVAFLDGQIVRDEPVPNPRSAQKEWEALVRQNTEAAQGTTVEEVP